MKRLQKKLDDHVERIMEELRKLDRDDRIKNPKIVRTYNFQRNEAKDHRTGNKANLKKVLDGNLGLL